MTNTTPSPLKVAFLASLARKASAAGVSIEGLTMEGATFDQTWGDRCGYAFAGLPMADLRRVAEYFVAWYAKHGPKGSYNAQRSLSFEGECHYLAFCYGGPETTFGRWHKGPYEGPSYEGAPVPCENRPGLGVSTTYYPCAD